ncbi:metallophosphoesterase [Lysinibacillus sp. UGB7]|uniref:metallophosphoesterase n=1 Tax=Lysinibacillus sp. UGB7 TaxID=3411039 RepID=UPI003B7AF55E
MYYIFSDVHGQLEAFEKAISNWNREDILIFLGDAVDRGPKSINVLQRLKELHDAYPDKVICLLGNHDKEFLNWLANPDLAVEHFWEYLANTLHNVLDEHPDLEKSDLVEINKFINKEYKDVIDFLKTWGYFYETPALRFVHAGFNYNLIDWKHTSKTDMIWDRTLIEAYKTNTTKSLIDKRTVVGHTPTSLIRADKKNDVFISFDEKLIAIDGGCTFGGQLNTLRFDECGEILEIKAF